LSYAHPGKVLLEQFLTPRELSCSAIARATGVPSRQINEIIHGRRRVTADTAIRLASALGTSARYWLILQADHDLAMALRLFDASFHEVEPIAVSQRFYDGV
jgi:addiction module HigA family antidote